MANRRKVLVLGSGRVAGPLVSYLLDQPGVQLTIASDAQEQGQRLIGAHPDGTAITLLVDDLPKLGQLIESHVLVISLLPAQYHPVVADLCVEHQTHMVTASYVSKDMRLLDEMARRAGVIILNEVGLDPGIDHMSAMRTIDHARKRGAKIISFKSYCGGLPAPDANDNPFGYKFSWSPRAVLSAAKNAARWRAEGREVVVPGPRLFAKPRIIGVDGVGEFEAYPNRDSLGYIELYGLEGVETMHRGTLRYPGWCLTWQKIIALGLVDENPITYPAGTTLGDFTTGFLREEPTGDLRRDVADQLHIDEASSVLDRLDWLGLFSDEPLSVTGEPTTPLDVLAVEMEKRMRYEPGQRDMIIMRHGFIIELADGHRERVVSIMVDYGQPNGESAMARTVGWPAAIAARLILDEQYKVPGVHIPVTPDLYNPILDELEKLGITYTETSESLQRTA